MICLHIFRKGLFTNREDPDYDALEELDRQVREYRDYYGNNPRLLETSHEVAYKLFAAANLDPYKLEDFDAFCDKISNVFGISHFRVLPLNSVMPRFLKVT